MREKDYIVIIGPMNIDTAGYSHHPLNYADSNPGKIKFTPGGAGKNIAHSLALLGENAWLLSVVSGDSYEQSLLAQTNQSGAYVDKCSIVLGENIFSYLSLPDSTGEMPIAINDMNISDCVSVEFLTRHQEFTHGAKVIITDRNLNEEALVWVPENSEETPVFIDPVSAWECVKIRDHLSKIHILEPNRLEAEASNGVVLSGREDATKVVAWFHQHGLNRLVLNMGEDSIYYSDINSESGRSAPIRTNAINAAGANDAMTAGLASCWVDGMPFIDSIRLTRGYSSMTLACEYTNNPEPSVANVTLLVEGIECLN